MSEGRDLQDLHNYRNNSNLQHVTFLCSICRFLFFIGVILLTVINSTFNPEEMGVGICNKELT
jgi:hypothetical protein